MVRWVAVVILLVFFLFGNYSFFDLREALNYYGKAVLPTNYVIGGFIIVVVILAIIFLDKQTYSFLKSLSRRIKVRRVEH